MEMQLKNKVSIEGHQKLQKLVEDLTNQINWKKETFKQDCYNKRLNLIVYDIKETPWETKEKTKEIFNQLILQGLRLNPNDFCIIDLHQLPQTPITKNGVQSTRPIIVLLLIVPLKNMLSSRL